MNKYQVLIHVKNFYLLCGGKAKLVGYYQTLSIKGDSPDQAEMKAVEMARNDQEIWSIWVKEKQKNPPEIFAEEIVEMSDCESSVQYRKSGRTFYTAKQWWQFWK